MTLHLPDPRKPSHDLGKPANTALKLSVWPVTALAVDAGGRGTGPGCARAAPGHPAAYRWR
jgi:hypothetical protein